MERTDKFYKSKKQFAVDMSSMEMKPVYSQWRQPDGSTKTSDTPNHRGTIRVVYFKKKDGVLSVNEGFLWGWFGENPPKTPEEFLKVVSTRAYGPDVSAKWDGKNLWGQTEVDSILYYRDFLDPILKNYPAIPEGYDGWWSWAK